MIVFSLLVLLAGVAAFAMPPRLARFWGPCSAVVGGLAALAAALLCLLGGSAWESGLVAPLPAGSLRLGLDALSAVFVIPIGLLGALGGVYGHGYLDAKSPALGRSWAAYDTLLAAMLLVVLARDGFLFLGAWELMSLASFLLVLSDSTQPGVGRAGWIYLVATHTAAAFLLAFFLLLAPGGDLDFAALHAEGATASLAFVFALIGFGAKAGFVPLHIWLPEAHPAAPSHVSAVMSGAMIKTGIYGLLRALTFLGATQGWWGGLLLAIGLVSGLLGVLFALAQHDLKKLLAYHSIENIGIIAMGLGLGLIGLSGGHPILAALGLAGGLFHVVNHGLFKGLLFMGAGAVAHAGGTREMDRLGGLLKRMPWTGATFLIGAAAISALPPLNGFASEFLIYLSAAGCLAQGTDLGAALAALLGLALIGALALACFTKATGVVFLGEPRSEAARKAHEAPWSMRLAMLTLAACCVATGLGAPFMLELLAPAVAVLMPAGSVPPSGAETLGGVTLGAGLLLATLALLLGARRLLLKGREVRQGLTWDCGYAAPSARMQYTSSSFAAPLVGLFGFALRSERHLDAVHGDFPRSAAVRTHTADWLLERLFAPFVQAASAAVRPMRRLQGGHLNLYILYIFVTIIALLVINLR